jgi:hypothetical protein
MYHSDGWIEEGVFRDGELHGFGRVIKKNGVILEGNKLIFMNVIPRVIL